MEVSTAYLREFVRKVFRDASNNAKSPSAILDELADAALDSANEIKGSGSILTQSSDGQGNSSAWSMLSKSGGQEEQLKLIDAARSAIGSETDLNVVLSRFVTVRRTGTNFAHYRL